MTFLIQSFYAMLCGTKSQSNDFAVPYPFKIEFEFFINVSHDFILWIEAESKPFNLISFNITFFLTLKNF